MTRQRPLRPLCSRQAGFSLIAAIFLLVVVAALVVYMGNLRVVQQTTLAYGLRGAAALQAARSGIEWGIYQAFDNDACPSATSFTPAGSALADYTVDVVCAESDHAESSTITVYRITATATTGTFGSLDYVRRELQATVSLDPP